MAVYLIIDIEPKDRGLYAQYVQKVPTIIEKIRGKVSGSWREGDPADGRSESREDNSDRIR